MTQYPRLKFNVVTYNVLSSAYYKSDTYRNNEMMSAGERMSLLRKYFESKKGSIFALQELSREQADELAPFFEENGYSFHTSLYGSKQSGYMGVGIAYPNRFRLHHLDTTRLADLYKWTVEEKKSKWREWFDWIFAKRAPESDASNASRRWNTLLSVHLSERSQTLFLEKESSKPEFVLSTYHMPCAFTRPQVMKEHAALAVQHSQSLQKKWGARGLILAGDFNTKPEDPVYEMITKGSLPDLLGFDTKRMHSAYSQFHTEEPETTNCSQTWMPWMKTDPNVFSATLDYIFYYGMGLQHVPEIEAPEELCPNGSNPSDHIPVEATFCF